MANKMKRFVASWITKLKLVWFSTLCIYLCLEALSDGIESVNVANPQAIPTFHCIGLYWSPPGGAPNRCVFIRFRPLGEMHWWEGLPMRYNPIDNTDEDLADYRGSIVNLTPGTTYEIELKLEGTDISRRIRVKTWKEKFPEGKVIHVSSRNTPLVITESGRPDAYRVYDGGGAVIDVRHEHDACIRIAASYVIIRNFVLRGAGSRHNLRRTPIGAIIIEKGHDIVIEHCDIADWGRINPQTGFGFNYDSAVLCRNSSVKRVIIQRCKMHHPFSDSNHWYEPVHPTHPRGPQCISFFNTAGNHVIRYNECYSDLDHMFNDIIGGGSNGSFRGAPGPDSDIYCNFISHCWDDGLEVEGGNRNVRVWGNYITQAAMMIGNAPTSIGPLYIWQNVVARSQWRPGSTGGYFLKMGYADSESWMRGHMYIFHNTIFSGEPFLPTGGLGGNRIVKHTVSRNNILHVHSSNKWSLSCSSHNVDNDFDFDLFNGRVPEGSESHGTRGIPKYITGSGLNRKILRGNFQLANDSSGRAAGEMIPNFTPPFDNSQPDIGAHQHGAPPMEFGVNAKWKPRLSKQ